MGVLFTIPSRYCSLSVIKEYLALRGGSRRFTRNSTCSMLLGMSLFSFINFKLQDYHFLWLSIPTYSSNCPNRLTIVPLPLIQKLSLGFSVSLAATKGIVFYFLFLQVLRCFSSLGSLLLIYEFNK